MPRPAGAKTRNFPGHPLEKALVVIRAIVDKGAGKQMDRLLVAEAIGRTPSSSEYKKLLSSSRQYGLTTGTEKADYIVPTDLGLRITKPERQEDVTSGMLEACLSPDIFRKFYTDFNRNKLPDLKFLKNMLEKSYGADPSFSEELAELIIENAKFCGILQDISGSQYIRMDDPRPTPQNGGHNVSSSAQVDDSLPEEADHDVEELGDQVPIVRESETPKGPRQLFVAHGKNRKPLEDLKRILTEFKIPFKVAVDEPHKGRPISSKVAELMRECSAGVFIFTKDEKFFREEPDGTQQEVWRPSENAVYELGAASILWDRKIIILREDGVNFPSDFSDLGYITFKDGEIAHKALELLKELVGLQLVKVEAA